MKVYVRDIQGDERRRQPIFVSGMDTYIGRVIDVTGPSTAGYYKAHDFSWHEDWLDFPTEALVVGPEGTSGVGWVGGMYSLIGQVHTFLRQGDDSYGLSWRGMDCGYNWNAGWLDFNYKEEDMGKNKATMNWEAVDKSAKMWEYVAANGVAKEVALEKLFGRKALETVKEKCYLCEVAVVNGFCEDRCPLLGLWGERSNAKCGDDDSPYRLWTRSDPASALGRSYAWQVVKLHHDWLAANPKPKVTKAPAKKVSKTKNDHDTANKSFTPRNISDECTGELKHCGKQLYMEISWPGRVDGYKVVAHVGMTDKPVVNGGFEVRQVSDHRFEVWVMGAGV